MEVVLEAPFLAEVVVDVEEPFAVGVAVVAAVDADVHEVWGRPVEAFGYSCASGVTYYYCLEVEAAVGEAVVAAKRGGVATSGAAQDTLGKD